ncbi:mersacidin family lantibiotic [Bacillus tropicus]|uniref:Type 2 lantibiotic n=1 Tax=Bacillus tropicus TaxID=2026188 RepID=A0A5C4ZXQ9_9BACI|nr:MULTISPECIES: mersacidin family lantibiotic [Bacillus cereus group]PJZ19973.1 type 2 lantibiotic [Bacillus cereus]MCB4848641.1 mersacidin family lantibiotic [Bacillus tropicus]MCW9134383.1 mersacidin family lantibiotic [Bacillus paramycoides]MCW9134384.1 mersacidin family lantibiotic [Bacillus paramycoides]TNP10488.1 type 2 lantibiotic [Bacillus tropicus]
MSKEQMIEALKNPEARKKLGEVEHPSGKPLNELTLEELAEVQGAGDVSPETTPVCITVGAATGYVISKVLC